MIMEPYYDYGGSVAMDAVTEGVAGFMLVFMVVYYLLIGVMMLASYILCSLSTYTIAKRRGIHHAWLAWVPLGSQWILGSISDQYQYLVKGRVRNRRKVLLGLSVGAWGMIIPMAIMALVAVISEAAAMDAGEALFGAALAVILLGFVVMMVLAIILAVFQWIALYDLYASCDPGNGTVYLVLSILISVTLPFFLFGCRKKDMGMPPRKHPEPVVSIQEDTGSVEETTEE